MPEKNGLQRAGMSGHQVTEGSCEKCSDPTYPKAHDCGGFEHFEGSKDGTEIIDNKFFWGFRSGCDKCSDSVSVGLHTVGDPECSECAGKGDALIPHECGGLVHYLDLGDIGHNSKCDKCNYDGTYRNPEGEWF